LLADEFCFIQGWRIKNELHGEKCQVIASAGNIRKKAVQVEAG
jgi:hypothetical protein